MKIRYSQWIRDRMISVNTLRFDLDNPRLRDAGKDEKSIIAALAEAEDLGELLKKFARNGYAPIERMVVVYDGTKPIVIEGNRRLAVCKMLLAPEKAPAKLAGHVTVARNELGIGELPSRVGCDIAPDLAEAKIYAYMKHAEDKFFRPWAKIQQAIVDCAMADRKEKGEAVEIELTDAEVRDARAMVELYRLAGILSRDAGSGLKSESLREFPYEAVKRVFLSKEAGVELGLKADKTGIQIKGDLQEFTDFYRKTLKKMAEGRATREFNTVDQAKEWIQANNYKPKGGKTYRLSAQIQALDVTRDSPKDSAGGESISPVRPKAHVDRRKSKVFPESLVIEYHAPRLATVLKEVEGIDVGRNPNTGGVMLRCVLELAVEVAFHERQLIGIYKQWLRGRGDTLKTRIQWLHETKPFPFEKNIERILNSLLSGADSVATLESLNGWVHSNWCPAAGIDVRVRATSLTPLITLLMAKP